MRLKSFLFLLALLCNNTFAQNVWTQMANFGGASRYAPVGFSIGNKGYIGCGFNASSNFNDIWEYDPVSNLWTQKASVTSGRAAAVSFVIGNKAYVCMGVGSTFYNDLQEYNPITNMWVNKTPMPAAGRYGGFAFAVNGKGYVGGGNPGSGTNPCLNDFYEYDPANDSWATKSNFPGNPRYGMAGFSIGTAGYAGLGLNESFGVQFYDDLFEYTPATNTWQQKANLAGIGRNYPTCFTINNEGYLCGGENFVALNDFYKYNPVTNSWSQLVNFGGGIRWAAAGFSIGNKGYMGMGNDFAVLYNDFWEYAPVVSIPETQTQNNISIVYSNNFIELIFLHLEPSKPTFKLFTSNGVEIFSQSIKTKTFKIPKQKFRNGVYLYTVSKNNFLITSGKLAFVN
ncbi:MAG TPA: kelch repeat-containing protein [Bacteroidia bacterium]|nr:kelch repeat-containing protein [Bacteroidia bacterium]HNU33856.1 kelch repeat-containing protein [Bacteroidia bacterium]